MLRERGVVDGPAPAKPASRVGGLRRETDPRRGDPLLSAGDASPTSSAGRGETRRARPAAPLGLTALLSGFFLLKGFPWSAIGDQGAGRGSLAGEPGGPWRPAPAGTQVMKVALLPGRTDRRPGRRTRAASGMQADGLHQIAAPYPEMAKSNDASGKGARSALPRRDGKSSPSSCCWVTAVASWAGELSIPTSRAPCRASQAET